MQEKSAYVRELPVAPSPELLLQHQAAMHAVVEDLNRIRGSFERFISGGASQEERGVLLSGALYVCRFVGDYASI